MEVHNMLNFKVASLDVGLLPFYCTVRQSSHWRRMLLRKLHKKGS